MPLFLFPLAIFELCQPPANVVGSCRVCQRSVYFGWSFWGCWNRV